jgi:hypothetical protein
MDNQYDKQAKQSLPDLIETATQTGRAAALYDVTYTPLRVEAQRQNAEGALSAFLATRAHAYTEAAWHTHGLLQCQVYQANPDTVCEAWCEAFRGAWVQSVTQVVEGRRAEEAAQREQATRAMAPFKVGDKVFRRSDLNKRYLLGEIEALGNGYARVAWPHRYFGGNGTYHSELKCGALVLATDKEIARRQALKQQRIAAQKAKKAG